MNDWGKTKQNKKMDRELERLRETKRWWGAESTKQREIERCGRWQREARHTYRFRKSPRTEAKPKRHQKRWGRRQRQDREGGPRSPGGGCPASASQPDPGLATQPLGRQQGCSVPHPPPYLWDAASPRPAAT